MLHDKPIMTFGSGGQMDYAVVANNGPFCLAIKFYGIAPGSMYGQPGGLILFRVRTHDASEQLNAVDHDFDYEAGGSPAEAWDGIAWEKGDPTYQSTSLAMRFEAEMNPQNLGPVVRAIDKLDIAEILLKKIESVVGSPSRLAISKAGLEAYLDQTFRPGIEKLREKAMQQAQTTQAATVQSGSFFTAGELLEKLAKAKKSTEEGKGGLSLH